MAVAGTLLYRFGVAPRASVLAVAAAGAAIGVGRLAIATRGRRGPGGISRGTRRDWIVGLVCFAAVLVATVLPHVLGGANFAIFQANRHDAINYVSNAV